MSDFIVDALSLFDTREHVLIATANTARANRQGKSVAEIVKMRLIERRRGETISSIARKLGYARNTVSLAINRDMFPEVRRRVLHHLRIRLK